MRHGRTRLYAEVDPWVCVWCRCSIHPSEAYQLDYGFPIHYACFADYHRFNSLPREEVLTNEPDNEQPLDKKPASLLTSEKEKPVHV